MEPKPIIIFWKGEENNSGGVKFENEKIEVEVLYDVWNYLQASDKNNRWKRIEEILYVEEMKQENTWQIVTRENIF